MDIKFQHLLIDALDRFNESDTSENSWEIAVDIAQHLGANALNVVSLGRGENEVHWVRSNMSSEWLNNYVEQDFFEVDPLLKGANQSADTTIIRAGSLGANWSSKDRDLNYGIRDAQYESMFSTVYAKSNVLERKMIVFASDQIAEANVASGKVEQFRILGAILASHIAPPSGVRDPSVFGENYNLISPRERDILLLLAEGKRNDAIAFKLGIAEVTVRKHVENVRKKFGCATREQVLVHAYLAGYL